MNKSALFGLASDLHLEFSELDPVFFDWRGDVLLLAGDVCEDDNYKRNADFWSKVSDMAKEVYVIAGNHEYYKSELDVALDHIRESLAPYSNIRHLENETVKTHGVTLFGATMWTDFAGGDPLHMWNAASMMNDYKMIRMKGRSYGKIRPTDTLSLHKRSVEKLRAAVMSTDDPMLIMTHHAPCYKSISPRYVGDQLNAAYATEMSEFILDSPNIKAWVHGHIHHRIEYEIGECNVMLHARGYPGEINIETEYEVKPFRLNLGEKHV